MPIKKLMIETMLGESERIGKVLSVCGICSRREAESLISQGRIMVNDKAVTEPGTKINPESDRVFLDGRELSLKAAGKKSGYFLLNKPPGYLTTCKDPFKRKTIFDLFKISGHYFPVGRLDLNSRGLVLITNDGLMCELIIHPRNRIKKIYIVQVSDRLTDSQIEKLKSGIIFEGETYRAEKITQLKPGEKNASYSYRIELTEGKKREIRQMMKAHGLKVEDLLRVSIGPLNIEGLKEGQYRELTAAELEELKKITGYAKAVKERAEKAGLKKA